MELNLVQGAIAKINVSAGDAVVVTYPLRLAAEQRAAIHQLIQAAVPDGVKVLVLDGGPAVSIVRAGIEAAEF